MGKKYVVPQPDRCTIARIVRDVRCGLGMSIALFAAALGVSKTAVYKWESGDMCPKYGARERIVQLYPAYGDRDYRRERRDSLREQIHQAAAAYSMTYRRNRGYGADRSL